MNPTAQLLAPEVRELIQRGHYGELRHILHELPPADVADILADIEPELAALGFRFLPRDDAGEVFSYLKQDSQEELIKKLGTETAAQVVEAMSADDRARLLDELPSEVATRIVGSLSPEERKVTQAILGYPEDSVGRLMTPDYIRVRPEWTVAQVLDHIQRHGRDAETLNVLYVIDDAGKLVDDIRLRHVLLAQRDTRIADLMDDNYYALRADQPQEEAVQMMSRYDRTALPVVDSKGVLVGIVTVDDVTDVAEEEATEDIQKLGGVAALESPYIVTGHIEMYRKRAVWLSALFVGQTITILVLGGFQDQLDKATVLSIFMPLVISCGGNSGSQAATLVTRALALGEVGVGDWWRIVQREFVSAALLAVTLALMGFLCVEFFTNILKRPETEYSNHLGFTVAAAIAGVVLWGTVAGATLPLILKRLRLDPATASSPLVATLMDASGTIIYFTLAISILTGTVL